jgi:signal transduction histidine kinase
MSRFEIRAKRDALYTLSPPSYHRMPMELKIPMSQVSRRSRQRTATRQAVHEFNRSLVLIVDPDALQASIATRVQELFGPDLVLIFQLDPDRGMFFPSFSLGFSGDEFVDARLHRRGRLAKWLLINESCLIVPQAPGVYDYLSPAEQDLLNRLDIRVCVPLISLNRLTGIILLGSHRTDWQLTKEEVELLQLLANQAGLAFENATLYRQQQDRLRRLYRAERLAAAGKLAAGVAHEIRNPLTAIRSTVQYILQDYPEHNPKRELIHELLNEVDRIDQTVNGLLSLTRSSEIAREDVEVVEVLEQSLVLVGTQAAQQNVTVERRYGRDHFHVMGDAGQLKQVFLNLLMNALQVMPEGGRIIGTVSRCRPEFISPVGEWVQIEIADTGPGMTPDVLEKIFDPFFTTKSEGTGLGLSICHSIIQQHDGEIEVQSQLGRGTTALVRLPLIP